MAGGKFEHMAMAAAGARVKYVYELFNLYNFIYKSMAVVNDYEMQKMTAENSDWQ